MTEFDDIFNEVVEFHAEHQGVGGYPLNKALDLIFRAIQITMLSIIHLYQEHVHK